MGQRLHQAHANHVSGISIGGDNAAYIAHSALNAAGNDGRRVKQGAIPVESDQIELASRAGKPVRNVDHSLEN